MLRPATIIVSCVAFGCGTFVGYLVARAHLERQYDERLEIELLKTREYTARRAKSGAYSDPVALADQTGDVEEEVVEETEELVASSQYRYSEEDALVEVAKDFDYRREMPKREGKKAYVISVDEFLENPKDYDQRTLSYYEEDDTLIEDPHELVEDILGIIGPDALDQFGNGSRDVNLVYVRNDFLSMDFEIVRHRGSYESTLVKSLRHSRNHPRKFRIDDE